MIFPNQQQSSKGSFGRYSWFKLAALSENISPSLPLHFDKKYLPQNLCQRQYLKLTQCLFVGAGTESQSQVCGYQIHAFDQCRLMRDILILDGIKNWETKHIQSLDNNNRKMYLQGLTFKMDRLKQDYDKMPSTISKQIKLWEIQSQIKQLKWRIKYVRKLL